MSQQAMAPGAPVLSPLPQQPPAQPDLYQSLIMLQRDCEKQLARVRTILAQMSPEQVKREMVDTLWMMFSENLGQQASFFSALFNDVIRDVDERLTALEEDAADDYDGGGGLSDETLLALVQWMSEAQVVAQKALLACDDDAQRQAMTDWQARGVALLDQLAAEEGEPDDDDDDDDAQAEQPQAEAPPPPAPNA